LASQLPLFRPETAWKLPNLNDLPQSWGSGRVGIDVETRDEFLRKTGPGVRRGAYIAGYAIAIEDGPRFYLPVRHGDGDNLPRDLVKSYLQHIFKTFDGTLVGANLGYDLDFLWAEGIETPHVKWYRDVQVADPLINELNTSYSLEAIAARHGLPGKDERLLHEGLAAYGFKGRAAKGGIWALPPDLVGPYGEQDAALPLAILRRQERIIDQDELQEVFDLESKVLPILVRMRQRGVAVSEDRLDQIDAWARAEQQKAIDEANRLITRRLDVTDITKTAVLAQVLMDLGVELPKTATGKDSVTSAVLDSLDHPVGVHLRRAKKMSTLRSTFVEGIREHLINGRIHCTFNQLRRQKDNGSGDQEGAAYGRLSSANPNMQNQPARDPEIGKMWRSIYVPDQGKVWASMDYSQQEPRMAVHFAVKAGRRLLGDRAHQAAMEAARRYREDPTTDFHDMMTRMVHGDDILEREGKDAFKQYRKYCKNIYLGLSYGMGGAKLCRDLGLPTGWRFQWQKPGERRASKDYQDRETAMEKMRAGRDAGYDCKIWEAAGPEGQNLMDKFDREVPFIRTMAKVCEAQAKKQGYIATLSGRRCHFPVLDNGDYDWTHKAFNRLIQGSAADQTKAAVVALEEAGYPLQLQVHDEVCYSANSHEEAEAAAKIMTEVYPLEVPFKADVETGPSWGESM
jgi:DNA polymerase I-like protein with 3'-5' exonuclease and polymerase domains